MTSANKRCPKCKEEKPRTVEYFTVRSYRIDSWCKECMHKSQKKYYDTNKTAINEKKKKAYNADIETYREKHRVIYHNNREKLVQRQRDSRLKRIQNNICTRCSEPSLPKSTMCEKHLLYNIAYTNLGDGNRWGELKQILIDQNYKDPYTGEDLELGDGAQLDHIYPRKRFPEKMNDIHNFQFLNVDTNRFKNNFTPDEFISFCIKILNHLQINKVA